MLENSSTLVDDFLELRPDVGAAFDRAIAHGGACLDDAALVRDHFDPMVSWLYDRVEKEVQPDQLSAAQAAFFIGEISVFARFNATLLLRAAESVRGFCPELAQELTRNFLEEGGERGKLPAHYVIFSGALIQDLNLRVNGWIPRVEMTHRLLTIIDLLAWSHCPSTILGMYYATEAVAISETTLLKKITNRLGLLKNRGTDSDLPNLDFYYGMHLDDGHEAATSGVAVERGHQDGIARFIIEREKFGFSQPQIIDGFLQMLGPFVEQWMCINRHLRA